MWYKTLIIFAAVSSAIAADDKYYMLTKIHKKLDEFKGLYSVTANRTYEVAKDTFQKTNLTVAHFLDGIKGNFPFDDAAKNVSYLSSKANELGKNITACPSLNNLELLKTEQTNMTIEAIDQFYSGFANNILVSLNDTLHFLERVQNKKALNFDLDIKQCLSFDSELAQRSCLWRVLTEIEKDIIMFQSNANSLVRALVYRLFKMQNRIIDTLTDYFGNWKEIVKVVVDNLNSCAEDVFGSGNRTVGIVGN